MSGLLPDRAVGIVWVGRADPPLSLLCFCWFILLQTKGCPSPHVPEACWETTPQYPRHAGRPGSQVLSSRQPQAESHQSPHSGGREACWETPTVALRYLTVESPCYLLRPLLHHSHCRFLGFKAGGLGSGFCYYCFVFGTISSYIC